MPLVQDDYTGDVSTTGRVPIGGLPVAGVLTAGDEDWFQVLLTAGQTYRFQLSAPGTSLLPFLSLRSAAGALACNGDKGAAHATQVTYTPTQTGTYFLSVAGMDGSAGAYRLGACETCAPTVLSMGNPGARVSIYASFTIEFSEAIKAGSGWVVLTASNGSTQRFSITDPACVGIDGSKLTFFPSDALAPSTGYRIELTAGAVQDIAGNAYDGHNAYSFTTGSAAPMDEWGSLPIVGGLITAGTTTTGDFEAAGDLDRYAIDLVAGRTYTFRADAMTDTAAADPALRLYGPLSSSTPLAANDNGGGGTSALLTYTPQRSGTYYVDAYAVGAAVGGYTLSSASSTDSVRPLLASATQQAIQGRDANIEMRFSEAVKRGPIGTIWLKNAAGATIETFAPGSPAVAFKGNTLTVNPAYSLPAQAGLYLSFDTGSVTDLAGNALSATKYTFSAAADLWGATAATSGAVVVDGAVRQNLIETAGDSDWFAVNLLAGKPYAFELEPVGGAAGLQSPKLELHAGDSANTLLAWADSRGGADQSAILNFTPTASGTYYLAAADTGGGTGSYILQNMAAWRDTTAPVPLASAAAAVEPGAPLSIVFNDRIERGQGLAVLKTGGAVVESFDVATSTRVGIHDKTITVDPTLDLAPGRQYTLELQAGAVRDLAGNTAASAVGTFTTDDHGASAASAGYLRIDSTENAIDTVTGTLETAGDHDWYRVDLAAGQRYTLTAHTAAGVGEPQLKLYDANGVLVQSAGIAGRDFGDALVITPSANASYYVEVGSSTNGTGTYSLTADAGKFSIDINLDKSQAAPFYWIKWDAFEQVVARADDRWEAAIMGYRPAGAGAGPGTLVDDISITLSVANLDGPGGAFAAFDANSGPNLRIVFDGNDVNRSLDYGQTLATIEHEIGEALGLYTANLVQKGLVNSSGFTGTHALQEYGVLLGHAASGYVPLARDGHSWHAVTFGGELMTSWSPASPSGTQLELPISVVTLGALEDLGWVVNYAVANPFSLGLVF